MKLLFWYLFQEPFYRLLNTFYDLIIMNAVLLVIFFFLILFDKADNKSTWWQASLDNLVCCHAFEIKKQSNKKYTEETLVSSVDYKTP